MLSVPEKVLEGHRTGRKSTAVIFCQYDSKSKSLFSGYENGLVLTWKVTFKKGTFKKAGYSRHFWADDSLVHMQRLAHSEYTAVLGQKGNLEICDQSGHLGFKRFVRSSKPISAFSEILAGAKRHVLIINHNGNVCQQSYLANSGFNSEQCQVINYGSLEKQNDTESKATLHQGRPRLTPCFIKGGASNIQRLVLVSGNSKAILILNLLL